MPSNNNNNNNNDHPFNVVRLDLPLDAATFDGAVRGAGGIALRVCATHDDDAATWAAMQAAHLYHVSSARDDLPAHWFVAAPLIERCPELLAVSTYGAGFDTVDVDACSAAGICVFNQAGSNAHSVAEHTLGFLISLKKRIAESDKRLRRGERFPRQDGIGIDLEGSVLGIIGIGYIGTRVTQLAQAFGVQVLACDPLVDPAEIRRRGAEPVTLDELLRRADAVSIHCPLDATTRDMINTAEFAAMKDGAVFISTARGGIHNEDALYDAIKAGKIKGAGLDVWLTEPPAATHPLLQFDTVLATFHNAGVTVGARQQMATLASSQIIGLVQGEKPSRLINPEVWPRFAQRYEQILGRPIKPN